MNDDWKLYRDRSELAKPRPPFPEAPPWRNFAHRDHRAETYQATAHEIEMVNAAIYLRRPLLVTGKPGLGKSSLIYAVAAQLGLGPVLKWSITSRSTVRSGLYEYDAIARLHDANFRAPPPPGQPAAPGPNEGEAMSRYLRLGPLGTALLPSETPQPLLIDEIDKADVDFPNDLLHAFEDGRFEIPELQRIAIVASRVSIRRDGEEDAKAQYAAIDKGRVQCDRFPFVVITSNGERDLPAAFLRRCLRLKVEPPDGDRLNKIIGAHFPELATGDLAQEIEKLVQQVASINKDPDRVVATDQLLNAVYILRGERAPAGEERKRVVEQLLRELGQGQ